MKRFACIAILTLIANTAISHARVSTSYEYGSNKRPALSIELDALNEFLGGHITPLNGGYWLCTDFIVFAVDPLGVEESSEPVVIEPIQNVSANRLECNPEPLTSTILGVDD